MQTKRNNMTKINGIILQYLAGCSAALTLFSVGIIFGWMNPVLERLVSSEPPMTITRVQSSWVATLPQLGSLVTALPGGFLADCCGRKNILIGSAPVTLMTWVVIYFTHNVITLMVTRVIQGLVVGITSTVVPIYLSEIAEPKVRGSLGNFFMLAFTLGQLYEFSVGPFVSYSTFAAINTIPILIFLLTFFYFPETPYHLLMKGKSEKAKKSLQSFRKGDIEEEFQRIKKYIDEENERGDTWLVAFTSKAGRKSLLITSLVSFVMFTGSYNAAISYSSSIFLKTTGRELSSNLFTIAMGVLMCIGAALGSVMLDLWGRKPTMLFSLWGEAIFNIPTGIYYVLWVEGFEVASWWPLPVGAIIIGSVMSLFGICATKVYQAELFATASRGFATGLNTLICGVTSSLTVLLYVPLDEAGFVYMNFFIFAVGSIGGALTVHFYAPETKGKTFEEIQDNIKTKAGQGS